MLRQILLTIITLFVASFSLAVQVHAEISEPTAINAQSSEKSGAPVFTVRSEQSEKKSLHKDSLKNMGENVPSFGKLASTTLKGLLYCVGTILLGVALYRRFIQPQEHELSTAKILVLGRKVIAPKTSLLIVEADGRKFFLVQLQDDVRLLSELQDKPQFDDDLIAAFEPSAPTDLFPRSANS